MLHGDVAVWIETDSALQLSGFQLFRADCDTEIYGKWKGGGICFYTSNDMTVIL